MENIEDFEIWNGKLIKYTGFNENVTIPDNVTMIGKCFRGLYQPDQRDHPSERH